jgi:hypothetical protein
VSWAGPGEGRPFLAMCNVGLFYESKNPPFVPDVMLSIDVRAGDHLLLKENRSYFVWLFGKPPDVAIEIVSDQSGGEDSHKMLSYARMGIPNYVIFDPENRLKGGTLRVYSLNAGTYELMSEPWFPRVGLGIRLWQGEYELCAETWLRWCTKDGAVIPTGKENLEQEQQRAEQERQRAEQERQRAEQERQRAEGLEAKLRALGIDPSL